jgi:hypothetical protein
LINAQHVSALRLDERNKKTWAAIHAQPYRCHGARMVADERDGQRHGRVPVFVQLAVAADDETGAGGARPHSRQGLTIVHFAAKCKPFLWDMLGGFSLV